MKFSYKKLWVKLASDGMMKKDLMKEAHVTSSTMAKMGKEEAVSLEILGRICKYFNCNIGDIVDVEFE